MTEVEQTLDIIRLCNEGLTFEEIAGVHGLTRDTVAGKVRRHREQKKRDRRDLLACKAIDLGWDDDAIQVTLGVDRKQLKALRRVIAS